ncbi:unnamed protein product [Lupinus luteus]|uniref:Uncharacterized protein n=1 Tax=Lupinus luteus TaxID=3873 RepID=A0AAV1XI57_LUPLU
MKPNGVIAAAKVQVKDREAKVCYEKKEVLSASGLNSPRNAKNTQSPNSSKNSQAMF